MAKKSCEVRRTKSERTWRKINENFYTHELNEESLLAELDLFICVWDNVEEVKSVNSIQTRSLKSQLRK
jgi:hypothetical protein